MWSVEALGYTLIGGSRKTFGSIVSVHLNLKLVQYLTWCPNQPKLYSRGTKCLAILYSSRKKSNL